MQPIRPCSLSWQKSNWRVRLWESDRLQLGANWSLGRPNGGVLYAASCELVFSLVLDQVIKCHQHFFALFGLHGSSNATKNFFCRIKKMKIRYSKNRWSVHTFVLFLVWAIFPACICFCWHFFQLKLFLFRTLLLKVNIRRTSRNDTWDSYLWSCHYVFDFWKQGTLWTTRKNFFISIIFSWKYSGDHIILCHP